MPSSHPTPSPPRPDFAQQANDIVVAGAEWVQAHWLQILVAAAAGTLIVVLLQIARRIGGRLCARDPGGTGWPSVVGRAIAETNLFFMITLAARLVAGYASAPVEVAETIRFLFTVASVFQVAIWARELILGAVERRAGAEHAALTTAMGLIRVLVTVALFAIALVVLLDNLGVNVTGLIAGLGVGGIAIGLAAQGIFADLFAALAIIFDRPFRRGDVISYDKTTGIVEYIGLKSTRVRAGTGEERIISNKQLLDKEIHNITRRDYRRISFTLGLVCSTPADKLRALPVILKEIVEGAKLTFVNAGFVNFASSSYDYLLEFDSPSPDMAAFFAARHDIGLAIIERLDREGICLAYPTQTSFTAAPDGHLVMPYPDPSSRDGDDREVKSRPHPR